MTPDILFSHLYVAVPAIAIYAYVPQIKKLVQCKDAYKTFSLLTWVMWLFSSLISMGYCWFSLHNAVMTGTCMLHVSAQILIIALVMAYYLREEVLDPISQQPIVRFGGLKFRVRRSKV